MFHKNRKHISCPSTTQDAMASLPVVAITQNQHLVSLFREKITVSGHVAGKQVNTCTEAPDYELQHTST